MRTLMILLLGTFGILQAEAQRVLQFVGEIPLPRVEGRIDHMDIDVQNRRLFIAALGNNSVEVVDLKQRKVIRSMTGLDEPQGIRYISKSNKIVVANGGDGSVRIFDGSTFEEAQRIKFADDADNVRYDSSTDRIYVGYGEGAIGLIDALTFKELGVITLPGHPESFQLEQAGSRIFVNVPAAKRIIALDGMNQKQISSIELEGE